VQDVWAAFGVEAGVEDGFEHSSSSLFDCLSSDQS
jgi:hypothetical protein